MKLKMFLSVLGELAAVLICSFSLINAQVKPPVNIITEEKFNFKKIVNNEIFQNQITKFVVDCSVVNTISTNEVPARGGIIVITQFTSSWSRFCDYYMGAGSCNGGFVNTITQPQTDGQPWSRTGFLLIYPNRPGYNDRNCQLQLEPPVQIFQPSQETPEPPDIHIRTRSAVSGVRG
jgi:hypothetical protein